MSTNLNQMLQEAQTRLAKADQKRVETEAAFMAAQAMAQLAGAEATVMTVMVNMEAVRAVKAEAEAELAQAKDALKFVEEFKAEAEVRFAQAKAELKTSQTAKAEAEAGLLQAKDALEAVEVTKVKAYQDLALAREEFAKFEPNPEPVAEPEPVGFWTRLFKRQPAQPEVPVTAENIVCPNCGQSTPQGEFCEQCGGAL